MTTFLDCEDNIYSKVVFMEYEGYNDDILDCADDIYTEGCIFVIHGY